MNENLAGIVVENNLSLRTARIKVLEAAGAVFAGASGREAITLIGRSNPAYVMVYDTTQPERDELVQQQNLHPEIHFLWLYSPANVGWIIETETKTHGDGRLEPVRGPSPEQKEGADGTATGRPEAPGCLANPAADAPKCALPEENPLVISSLPQEIPSQTRLRKFPGYVTLKLIGKGTFGEVYLVRDRVCGDLFAVKAILETKHAERELHALQLYRSISLSERCLAPICQVGYINKDAAQGIWYVTVIGDDQVNDREINPKAYSPRTLESELISQGRFSVKECKQVVKCLLKQAAVLHQHGLVHADIKPSNVIYFRGKPLLIDISLLDHASLQLSGHGTKGFRPSEGHGRPTGDIYSLGKLLYQLATARAAAGYGPSFSNTAPGDQRLAAIVQKACAENPDERYQSAEEMLRDINKL